MSTELDNLGLDGDIKKEFERWEADLEKCVRLKDSPNSEEQIEDLLDNTEEYLGRRAEELVKSGVDEDLVAEQMGKGYQTLMTKYHVLFE